MQGESTSWLCFLPLFEYFDIRNLPLVSTSFGVQSFLSSGSCFAPKACISSWTCVKLFTSPLNQTHQVENCHAQRYPALLATAHADEEGVEAVGHAVLAVPGNLKHSPTNTYLALCWQVPPTPPGLGFPLQDSPNTRSWLTSQFFGLLESKP